MDTIRVSVGTYTVGNGNIVQDNLRPVEFEGEKLAEVKSYGTGRGGGPTDTRGITETLYKTADGRLVVYVEDWSHWQGEPNTYSLHEVTEADLGPNGRFETLGREAGMGRPLTIDEALTPDDLERHFAEQEAEDDAELWEAVDAA
ncbi:MAG: hypothetical protein JW918_00970 [Anaerolineae bacterium]|nr:hypothetical protein [Anaerolineae bacterium]